VFDHNNPGHINQDSAGHDGCLNGQQRPRRLRHRHRRRRLLRVDCRFAPRPIATTAACLPAMQRETSQAAAAAAQIVTTLSMWNGSAIQPLGAARILWCNGRESCSYVVDREKLGDPAPGWGRSFIVDTPAANYDSPGPGGKLAAKRDFGKTLWRGNLRRWISIRARSGRRKRLLLVA
jgi:hypothetical protein